MGHQNEGEHGGSLSKPDPHFSLLPGLGTRTPPT